MRLYLCDIGGSSFGTRTLLKSETFAQFIDKNEHLELEIYVRRGKHPYLTSTYINGFVKDTPLRNLTMEETLQHVARLN